MYSFLKDLIDPLTISFFFLACGLAYASWKHSDARKSLRWVWAAYVLAWLASTNAVAYLAAGALEWRYPPVDELPEDVEAIVVLSGGMHAANDFLPQSRPTDDTLRRCAMAARLYHGRRLPIVVCGGQTHPEYPETLAEVMRRTLVEMGVADKDIYLEEQSSITSENAAAARRVLEEKHLGRAALVTDATHLPRAVGCFVKQGVDVVPVGAKYMASRFAWRVSDFLPRSEGVQTNNIALREAVGLLWYKLRGRI